MNVPAQSTLKLTHYGRKSGKPFHVTIWYTVLDGDVWIGSLDGDKDWVRNVRHHKKAEIDFGGGQVQAVAAEMLGSDSDKSRYRSAVAAKYPILSRVLGLFSKEKERAVFRLKPV